jgi:pyruvate-formate lyase
MTEELKSRLDKIAKKKQDLLGKEKLIKDLEKAKEKKKRLKKSIEIGKLACQFNIDAFDLEVLTGAFIEISERIQNSEQAAKWKTNANNLSMKETYSEKALSLAFANEVNADLKNTLKGLGFRWNKFRKEFYGYGKKQELEKLFKNDKCTIEELD